ncbi:hypothetical protein EVAR_15140_1 [Eumeta japonica]|uniref:Uncharacterized protein n=1 Tax=Eumeta variegata TaxID=151549 RepID=A0A4C1UJJ2_EUMVA|nr:hypothetical protein EVAR_15140_1 [Eumeta japonica]
MTPQRNTAGGEKVKPRRADTRGHRRGTRLTFEFETSPARHFKSSPFKTNRRCDPLRNRGREKRIRAGLIGVPVTCPPFMTSQRPSIGPLPSSSARSLGHQTSYSYPRGNRTGEDTLCRASSPLWSQNTVQRISHAE